MSRRLQDEDAVLARQGAEGGVNEQAMTEMAALYYQQNATQEELSQRYKLSRATIGRLLKRARESGIVAIRVLQHPAVIAVLEGEFQRRFGLERLLLAVDREDPETQRAVLGGLVANWLCEVLNEGTSVAVGMGRNVASVVANLADPPHRAVTFVAAMGGSSEEPGTNADYISRQFAAVFGGESETLYVPARVASPALRAGLLANETVRLTLDHARHADVAIVGVGDFGQESNTLRLGWATPEEFAAAAAEGTVGEINGSDFFDVFGRPTGAALRGRMVGLSMAELARIPNVVAVVAERRKAAATLGVLRSGIVNTLATTTASATAILELDDENRPR